ncbi:hypothetical protein L208DRAFT_725794 [Tricholoma matsutake]|nr:hypothetical protein L208DRAFT_725794 [Tricholoma matsutake 945]
MNGMGQGWGQGQCRMTMASSTTTPRTAAIACGVEMGSYRQWDGNTTGQGGENDNGEMPQVFFFILIIFLLLIFFIL